MTRVIKVTRKRFETEQLRDRILGKEPQEEVTELVTLEDDVKVPTEADIENETGKEEEEDSEEEDLEENNFTEEEA
jgi:hypothetical protein